LLLRKTTAAARVMLQNGRGVPGGVIGAVADMVQNVADVDLMADMPQPEGSDVFSSDPEVLERVVAHERGFLAEAPAQRTDETDEQRARALWRLGESLYRLRRFSDALEPLEAAEDAAKFLPGWELIWARSRCVRAGCLLCLKRWADVIEVTEELIDIGDWKHRAYFVQRGLGVRLVALKALDRWQEAALAAAAFRESLPAERSPSMNGVLVDAISTQGWAAGRAGDPESGLRFFDEAIALAIEEQKREPMSRALTQRAELVYAAGRSAEARATLQTVIDTFRDDPEDFAVNAVAFARVRKVTMRLRRHRS
jgi:tetratricopeptide (TPR) repeat protein